MSYFYWIVGCIVGLAWFSRIVDAALGVPKIPDISRPQWDRKPKGSPRVSIIVPARNEEDSIEQPLTQLLALDYDNYEVIAVDDRSTDRTGEIMDKIAGGPAAHGRLKIIHVGELPSGWMGKTHAMWAASQQASGDWLLFTDADVLFKPDTLRRALAYAESVPVDHLVLFPRMIMKRPGEKMMIAFFQTLFVFGHRPWKVADPKTKDHMGVGAFNLVRRRVYDAIGTYQALRFEVLDDMKLGKVVKNAGYAQRVVFGQDLISIHWAKGALGVVDNLTKNFFAVLSFQWWRALISSAGLAFLNLIPFLGIWLAHGWARLPYAVALLSLFLIYVGMSLKSAVPTYYFLLHPVSTTLFIYLTLRSMALTLSRGGVVWRGTFYPLAELRRGMV
jgi:cellulose synthase/poly-beta-1,6-N-acetylglucosamine synthase-like glycosyltransferase